MGDINSVVAVGRLTRDPEIRYTSQGQAVCNFSLAVNRKYGEGATADFFDCAAWGKIAEAMAQYCKKGMKVVVSGRLRQDRWEKDGVKHNRVSIVAFQVTWMSAPKSGQDAAGEENQAPPEMDGSGLSDDEIPF